MRPPRRSTPSKPAAPAVKSPTLLTFEVLVQGPTALNIPLFALFAEKDRYASEVRVLTTLAAARVAVGRKAAQALRAGEYGPFQVVHRRQRLARQSVAYSAWLAFATREAADRFARDHPARR